MNMNTKFIDILNMHEFMSMQAIVAESDTVALWQRAVDDNSSNQSMIVILFLNSIWNMIGASTQQLT